MSRAGNSKCLLESKLATPAGCRNGHARAHSRGKANRNRFSSACITPVVRREHFPGSLRDRSQEHVCPDVLCMLRKNGNCKADHPASFDRSGVFAGCFRSEMRIPSLNDDSRPDYRCPDAIVDARLFSGMARRLRVHDGRPDIRTKNAVLLTSSRPCDPFFRCAPPVSTTESGTGSRSDSRCRMPCRGCVHRRRSSVIDNDGESRKYPWNSFSSGARFTTRHVAEPGQSPWAQASRHA